VQTAEASATHDSAESSCCESQSPPEQAVTLREAKRAAREAVLRSAVEMVEGLAEQARGNYLTAKFLFEFAGLISDAEESKETAVGFPDFMRNLLDGPKENESIQTSAANLNLCSDAGTNICR
jgi:hypothetical protein